MERTHITMLIAGLGLTGTPRMMMDIVENIDLSRFNVSVAYKPEYNKFESDLLPDLEQLGIKTIPLRGKSLYDIRGIIDLFHHIRNESVKIIHCWDALGIAVRLLRIFSNFRVVQSYCNPLVTKGSFLYFWINKISSVFINGIVFCTPGVEASYREKKVIFLKGKKKALIPNCIKLPDIDKIKSRQKEIRKKWELNPDEIILTNIGFFNEQKGHADLLEAFRIVLNEVKNARLVIVGWGPLGKYLEDKSKHLDIQNNIIFAGKCIREAIFEILSITDVFVLSSLWEGFGIVLAEAMAMGKPVVSTKTVGSEFVVKHNETGLLVPPHAPEALAESILELIANPKRMAVMGLKGKKRVADNFSHEKYIKRHQAFYQEILGFN